MSPQKVHNFLSPFIKYLSQNNAKGVNTLPSLKEISKELNISVSSIREELRVAKTFGWVDIKPRLGIRNLPYTFTPAIFNSVSYGLSVNPVLFKQFSELRNHTETAYWYKAVSCLNSDDINKLKHIIRVAKDKLNKDPVIIPHQEHRQLHLTIYSRLDNLFVTGILEAFWDIYEAIGLNVYEDRKYLERVWHYHQLMVESISNGDYQSGYQALIIHMGLLAQREKQNVSALFE